MGILAIIGLASKAISLFTTAKSAVEQITGEPSKAEKPEDLQADYDNMTEEQQTKFIDTMSIQIKMYEAETHRMEVQDGVVTEGVLNSIPAEQAGIVALLRMTTRPKIALLLTYAVIAPIWVIIAQFFINVVIATHNVIITAYMTIPASGVLPLMNPIEVGFGTDGSSMYTTFLAWAISLIGGFMTLRQIGKSGGHVDDPVQGQTVSNTINTVKDLVGGVKDMFGKK